ncbi:MAG: hypothetical protein Q9184_001881, partial [Pyrenodesmia sp. 2 TL-2023]
MANEPNLARAATNGEKGDAEGALIRDPVNAGETLLADKPIESATQQSEHGDTTEHRGANKDKENGKDPADKTLKDQSMGNDSSQ